MYCIDSDVIIAIFRGDKELARKISGISPDEVFFTAITLCELFKGAYKFKQKEKSLELIYNFVSNYSLLGLNLDSCEIFGKDFEILDKLGKQTQEFDLLTSSIAKESSLILVTRNKRHFENIPGLKIEEW